MVIFKTFIASLNLSLLLHSSSSEDMLDQYAAAVPSPSPSTSPSPSSPPSSPSALPGIDCEGKCAYRCHLSSRQKLCERACGTCCIRCHCFPLGTSGNYEACPCYATLITHGGRHKCP